MKEGTSLDSTDIKRIIWEIMNKNMPTFDNLDEMDKFLNKHELQSSPRKVDNLKISLKEFKLVVKTITKNEHQEQTASPVNPTKHLRRK